MMYRVTHKSTLGYVSPVSAARLNLRLRPVDWPGQAVSDYKLHVTPEPDHLGEAVGAYVVNTSGLIFEEGLKDLSISSEFTIAVEPRPLPQATPTIEQARREALAARRIDVLAPAPYLFASRLVVLDSAIVEWGAQFLGDDRPVLEAASALAHAIYEEFAYLPGTTDSRTQPAEAFRERKGVCQDFAHVMISALRGQGIPAAYISGYLRTIPPPGQERLVGADAMHAWVAVWCGEQAGWIGLDPTNDRPADESHVVIAMGRDYADVAPVDGVFVGPAVQRMRVSVDVAPLAGG